MAYATSNPPQRMAQAIGGGGRSIWAYNSTDAHATVEGAGYFTNGDDLGLKVGDMMVVNKTAATIECTIHYVSIVTAGGAATIAAATLA